jgi:carboxylesterase type B
VAFYPAAAFASTFERAKTAFGDTVFTCQDWFIADRLRRAGVRRAFNYRWNTPDAVQLAAKPWAGVLHTSDLFFLFNGTKCVISAVARPPHALIRHVAPARTRTSRPCSRR